MKIHAINVTKSVVHLQKNDAKWVYAAGPDVVSVCVMHLFLYFGNVKWLLGLAHAFDAVTAAAKPLTWYKPSNQANKWAAHIFSNHSYLGYTHSRNFYADVIFVRPVQNEKSAHGKQFEMAEMCTFLI